jgi:hypothetical protein
MSRFVQAWQGLYAAIAAGEEITNRGGLAGGELAGGEHRGARARGFGSLAQVEPSGTSAALPVLEIRGPGAQPAGQLGSSPAARLRLTAGPAPRCRQLERGSCRR